MLLCKTSIDLGLRTFLGLCYQPVRPSLVVCMCDLSLTEEGLMSFYTHPRSLPQRFRLVLSSVLQHGSLLFSDVLDADQVQQAFEDVQACFSEEDDVVYTPALTLWVFLSQVLHKGEQRSCVAAVARVITLLVTSGAKACAEDTGAYCSARENLFKSVLERLTRKISEECESQLPENGFGMGGTSIWSMARRSACPTR